MNIGFLIAGLIAIAAGSLHVYTMEVWIYPKLKAEGFPATPFGPPDVTKGFFRLVWHFFTVSWLATITAMFIFSFTSTIVPYVNLVTYLLMAYWVAIIITIFIMGALSLEPGQSYLKVMSKAFQWMIIVAMLIPMFWGTTMI